MTTITVEVTAEDIAAGLALNCYKCPIAIAAGRAFGESAKVSGSHIAPLLIHHSIKPYSKFYRAPRVARLFMRKFDAGRPVAPFTFTLDVPS